VCGDQAGDARVIHGSLAREGEQFVESLPLLGAHGLRPFAHQLKCG
jgi:hypothetical protein